MFRLGCIIVAGVTVLFYDVLLTLAQEVQYVWSKGRWTFPKIAYIINRYGMCSLSLFFLDSQSFPSHFKDSYTDQRYNVVLIPFNTHSNDWVRYMTPFEI